MEVKYICVINDFRSAVYLEATSLFIIPTGPTGPTGPSNRVTGPDPVQRGRRGRPRDVTELQGRFSGGKNPRKEEGGRDDKVWHTQQHKIA